MLVANPALNVKTPKDVIDYLRSNPGKLHLAYSGTGSVEHLSALQLDSIAGGNKLTAVPYKGPGPAMTDLIGGQVSLAFVDLRAAVEPVRAGRLRAIGTTSSARTSLLPDVPTFAEAGVPGIEARTIFGLFLPPGSSSKASSSLYVAVSKALETPEVRDRLKAEGFDIQARNPAAFALTLKEDSARWAKIAKEYSIRAD